MDKLYSIICSIFPEVDPTALQPDLELAAIPGWDSMNAVNLELELEEAYGVDFSEEPLRGEVTLDQLWQRLD